MAALADPERAWREPRSAAHLTRDISDLYAAVRHLDALLDRTGVPTLKDPS